MNDNDNNGWALIPPWVLSDPKLSSSEKIIAGRVWGLSGSLGFCWASNAKLARELGLKNDTVSDIVRRLRSKGYVTVEIIRDNDTHEVKQRRIYPNGIGTLSPMRTEYLPHENRIPPTRKSAASPMKTTIETTGETTNKIKTIKYPTHPPLVVVDAENKTPCQVGHKCNNYKDIDTVKRAVEVYKAVAVTKSIKNPTGYICGVCRKGATLRPGHISAEARAEKVAAARAAKAAEEAAEVTKAAQEKAAQEAFLKLPTADIDNYINKIKDTMPIKLGEGVILSMAAATWAGEANHAE